MKIYLPFVLVTGLAFVCQVDVLAQNNWTGQGYQQPAPVPNYGQQYQPPGAYQGYQQGGQPGYGAPQPQTVQQGYPGQQPGYGSSPTYYGQAQQSVQQQMQPQNMQPQNMQPQGMQPAYNNQAPYGGQSPPGSYLSPQNTAATPSTPPSSVSEFSPSELQSLESGTSTGGGGSKGARVKGAAGTVGKLLGKAAGIAAPVAGAYAWNRMTGGTVTYGTPYGGVSPYGYPAYNPYAAGGFGNPYGYGGMPMGGMPMGGMGMVSPYGYQQPTMKQTLLNAGIRSLMGF